MNKTIKCPFCDNNITVDNIHVKTKLLCPACNLNFECKQISAHTIEQNNADSISCAKKYKFARNASVIVFLGICLFFYKAYEQKMEKEQNIKGIRDFICKIHPKRDFNGVEIRRIIADSLGFPHYISDIDTTEDEINIVVNHELEDILKRKYPEKSINDFKIMAKEELGFIMEKPDLKQDDLDSLVEHEGEMQVKNISRQTAGFDEDSELIKIASDLKIKLPLEAPKKTISECEKLINEKIESEISEILDKSKNDKIRELTQKYKPYKLGDAIAVTSYTKGILKGEYYGQDGTFLKVGETRVPIVDIQGFYDDPRFNENICDKFKREGLILINRKFNEDKNIMISKLKTKYDKIVFADNGYLFYNGNWISSMLVVQEMLDNRRKLILKNSKDPKSLKDIIMKECKNKIYLQHGYAISNDNLTPVNILIEKKASELLGKFIEKESEKKDQFKKDNLKSLYLKHGYININGQLIPGKRKLDQLVAEKNYPLLLENELKIATDNIPVDKSVALPDTGNTPADELYTKGQKLYDALNYANAIPLIYSAALKGHPKATQLLAICYQNGNFVKQDLEMAFKLFIKAIVLDNSLTSNSIVEAYKNGIGVQKSPDFAADWQAFAGTSLTARSLEPLQSP